MKQRAYPLLTTTIDGQATSTIGRHKEDLRVGRAHHMNFSSTERLLILTMVSPLTILRGVLLASLTHIALVQ
jgi:hypothetical protein